MILCLVWHLDMVYASANTLVYVCICMFMYRHVQHSIFVLPIDGWFHMLHIASPLMAQEFPGFFCAKLRRLAEIVGRRQRMPGLVAGTCEVPGLPFLSPADGGER